MWLRKISSPIRIAGTLLQQQRHRILVGRKELKQRRNLQLLSQLLQCIFIARKSVTVDKNVESGVFSCHDDVHAGGHHFELKAKLVNCR